MKQIWRLHLTFNHNPHNNCYVDYESEHQMIIDADIECQRNGATTRKEKLSLEDS